jgi:transposase InsO family protein
MSGAELAIERMCVLAGVSRRGFYRFDPGASRAEHDMNLRDAIQRIALEMPSYGRPRITAELRRRGWVVNPKRVYRIMREDNLLCLRRRKFLVTTDSRHGFRIYPNLAGEMTLSNVNQLWIADITYIRLESEFVYLAVVLDAFSRRVIGWALDRTLEAKLTVAALEMALSRRKVQVGLVHHSDRGVQYAADEYSSLLTQHGIQISMSRKGNPYDNARTESFMKTLKYEEVYRQEYRDLPDALRSLRRFIEKVYNEKRLHSALGYLPPTEFEANLIVINNCEEAASRQLSV